MTPNGLRRTDYWNRVTGGVRLGDTRHDEAVTDIENFVLPYAQVATAALHLWGVADGLTVTAARDQPDLKVSAGAAVDSAGHVIAVLAGSVAVTDPNIDPDDITNVPTVPVDTTGVTMPTGAASGTRYLTVRHLEVGAAGLLGNAPNLVHAPWLRLLDAAGFDDTGTDVVLARVSLTDGKISDLTADLRRHTGVPAERVQLRRPATAAGDAPSVQHEAAAELRARAAGGLDLDLLSPTTQRRTALTIDATGNIGIGVAAAQAALHIDRGVTDDLAVKLSSSGQGWGSGLQLANTAAGAKTYGIYSGSDAKLHVVDVDVDGGVDRVVIDRDGAVGVGATPRRTLHVEGLEIHSGGWAGGYSFANRTTGSFMETPDAGQRWVWYATDGVARLWSRSDLISVAPSGNVGIGIDAGQVQRTLHVHGSEIHSGGGIAGFSFANRNTASFVNQPGNTGQRWVWYAQDGVARLWSGADRMSFGLGNVGAGPGLDVSRRMRVRQGGDHSAGIWFFQDGAGDRGFVGMAGNDDIGFYGAAGGVWGLTMNTTTGAVKILGGNHPFQSALFSRGNIGIIAEGAASGIIATAPNAGVFNGDVRITGQLSKGGGGFRIDHPLDPQNRYLSHSFVESPDMLNVYRGTVTTDEHGHAAVELPDYFCVLNEDFGYQLTPVGALTAVAVTAGVADNRFTIASERPDVLVCWQVTGVRKDPWANAHRIKVEETKTGEEQTHLLHPAEYHGISDDAVLIPHT